MGELVHPTDADEQKAAKKNLRCSVFVGLPGFEPRMTGPESVVLPLHHSPIASAKIEYIFSFSKIFHEKIIFLFEIKNRDNQILLRI